MMGEAVSPGLLARRISVAVSSAAQNRRWSKETMSKETMSKETMSKETEEPTSDPKSPSASDASASVSASHTASPRTDSRGGSLHGGSFSLLSQAFPHMASSGEESGPASPKDSLHGGSACYSRRERRASGGSSRSSRSMPMYDEMVKCSSSSGAGSRAGAAAVTRVSVDVSPESAPRAVSVDAPVRGAGPDE